MLACIALQPGCGHQTYDTTPDATPPDAAPPPTPTHVLLTEVYSQVALDEFVEIVNPTADAIALDDYYLSDTDEYSQLPALGGASPPTIRDDDFVVGFPAGASIAPGQAIVVARNGGEFTNRFGITADLSIDGSGGAAAMRRIVYAPGSQLTDVGEPVVLFRWDGASDLVVDVDILLAGIPQPSNSLTDKGLRPVDGPDSDDLASSYQTDALTMPRLADVTDDQQSYKRTAVEGWEEREGQGNGTDGHDETAEDTAASWSTDFSAPSPGVVELTW